MPLTVRKFNAQVKDPQSGQMVPAGLLSSDSLQAIETAESAAITEIQQKGRQTRESIPDDYTELSDSVGEVKTQLNDIEETVYGDETKNYTEGKNISSTDGSLIDDSSKCVSPKIPYTWTGATWYYCNDNTSTDYGVAFYDSSDTLLKYFRVPYTAGGDVYREVNAETQGVSGTISYVRFSFKKNTVGKATNNAGTITHWIASETRSGGLADDVNELQTSFTSLSDELDDIKELTITNAEITEDVGTGATWTDGYVTKNGTVNTPSETTYHYSAHISVNPGDVLTTANNMRFVTAYVDETATESLGAEQVTTYTVPNTVTSVVVTLNKSYKAINKTYEQTQNILEQRVERLEETASAYNKAISTSAATLETGDTLEIGENIDTRKNDVIEFRGYITSFTSLTVGHGYMINHGRWFTIDDTNITLYRYDYDNQTAIQTSQQAHGLTFTHFIGVLINRGDDSNTFIEVNSDDGMYKWTGPDFHDASRGSITAFCTGTLTNVSLNALYRDFERDIFMFGDSYQATGSENRYPYYLFANGFDKYLMAGFAGANSAHGYSALTAILAKSTPKYIVWCLGMNNSDSDDAINADYKTILDNVISICENKGITPVLATIPNTPTRRHTYKNAYIKTLNCKYIDFAKAVGAESYPSTWYSGMLEENATPANRVHPTALGAKALYSQLITDFPEIMG